MPTDQPSFATIEQFEARHGTVATAEKSKVEALLADATSLILEQIPESTEPWVTEPGDEPPASVIRVCVAAAYRAWTNPNGLSRQTLGQATYTYSNEDGDAMFLTDREVDTVQRAGKRKSFGSIGMVTPFSGDRPGPSIFDHDIDQSL